MRPEIEALLERFAAGELPFAELKALATTEDEDFLIKQRLKEIVEQERREAAQLTGEADLLQRDMEPFSLWTDKQRAQGRDESELDYGNFCRETKVLPFKRNGAAGEQ